MRWKGEARPLGSAGLKSRACADVKFQFRAVHIHIICILASPNTTPLPDQCKPPNRDFVLGGCVIVFAKSSLETNST